MTTDRRPAQHPVHARRESPRSSATSWQASASQEFGQTKIGARRSFIEHNAQDLGTEDLITPTDMVVTLSHTGYFKSQPLAEYSAQKRGGRGKQATQTKEDDWVEQLFIANTHDYILCFTNKRARLLAEGLGGSARLAQQHAASRSSTCSRFCPAKR